MASARVREVLTTANDPLAVLIEIANDHSVDVQVRVTAATAVAPYMFPRLSATVVATAPLSARDNTADLVERLMHRFSRLAPPTPMQTIEAAPLREASVSLPDREVDAESDQTADLRFEAAT